MTTMLPDHRTRTPNHIRDHIRGSLPPTMTLDWMPVTDVEAIDALRPIHRRAALKFSDSIDELPTGLAGVIRQIADHATTTAAFQRESYRAAKLGGMVPETPAVPNLPAALEAAWRPVHRAVGDIASAVRAIVSEVGKHRDEMDRRHIRPAELRGEVYFGPSGGNQITPRELAEGERDGSILLELSYLDRLVRQWRSARDPPGIISPVAPTDLSDPAMTLNPAMTLGGSRS
jgi:hypothetical protein